MIKLGNVMSAVLVLHAYLIHDFGLSIRYFPKSTFYIVMAMADLRLQGILLF